MTRFGQRTDRRAEPSRHFDTSRVTIQRELRELSAQVFKAVTPKPPIVERAFQVKTCQSRIGRAVAARVTDCETDQ